MTYFVCVGEDDGPLQVPPLKVDEGAANSGSVPEPIASPWGDVGSTTNTRIRSRRASILEFGAKMEAFDEKELKDPVDWWCASTCRCNRSTVVHGAPTDLKWLPTAGPLRRAVFYFVEAVFEVKVRLVPHTVLFIMTALVQWKMSGFALPRSCCRGSPCKRRDDDDDSGGHGSSIGGSGGSRVIGASAAISPSRNESIGSSHVVEMIPVDSAVRRSAGAGAGAGAVGGAISGGAANTAAAAIAADAKKTVFVEDLEEEEEERRQGFWDKFEDLSDSSGVFAVGFSFDNFIMFCILVNTVRVVCSLLLRWPRCICLHALSRSLSLSLALSFLSLSSHHTLPLLAFLHRPISFSLSLSFSLSFFSDNHGYRIFRTTILVYVDTRDLQLHLCRNLLY